MVVSKHDADLPLMVFNAAGDLQRQQIEQLRKADYQSLAAAKRSGQLATIHFTLDLPDELSDVELSERCDSQGQPRWQ